MQSIFVTAEKGLFFDEFAVHIPAGEITNTTKHVSLIDTVPMYCKMPLDHTMREDKLNTHTKTDSALPPPLLLFMTATKCFMIVCKTWGVLLHNAFILVQYFYSTLQHRL